jgi:hypothetical protein
VLEFRVILDLKGYYATVFRRRVRGDVGKIAIQRNENGVKFLRFSYDIWVNGIGRQMLSQPIYFIPFSFESLSNGVRDTVIKKKSHTVDTSNSDSSRA